MKRMYRATLVPNPKINVVDVQDKGTTGEQVKLSKASMKTLGLPAFESMVGYTHSYHKTFAGAIAVLEQRVAGLRKNAEHLMLRANVYESEVIKLKTEGETDGDEQQ